MEEQKPLNFVSAAITVKIEYWEVIMYYQIRAYSLRLPNVCDIAPLTLSEMVLYVACFDKRQEDIVVGYEWVGCDVFFAISTFPRNFNSTR